MGFQPDHMALSQKGHCQGSLISTHVPLRACAEWYRRSGVHIQRCVSTMNADRSGDPVSRLSTPQIVCSAMWWPYAMSWTFYVILITGYPFRPSPRPCCAETAELRARALPHLSASASGMLRLTGAFAGMDGSDTSMPLEPLTAHSRSVAQPAIDH